MIVPAFAAVPVTSAGLWLAQEQKPDGGGQGADFGKSSPVGLLLLLVFFIAVAFLIRSMTKHLKRLPRSFGAGDGTEQDTAESDTAGTAADAESDEHGGAGGAGARTGTGGVPAHADDPGTDEDSTNSGTDEDAAESTAATGERR